MKFINTFKFIPTRDKTLNELQSAIYYVFEMIGKILNKNVHFKDNIYGEILKVADSGLADTDIEITHSLGRVPNYFFVINVNKGAIIYKSPTAWTETAIYLRSTVQNTAFEVFIF